LVEGLRAMVPALWAIADNGPDLGLEVHVHDHVRPFLLAQAAKLEALD
jgi:hypothetical protein